MSAERLENEAESRGPSEQRDRVLDTAAALFASKGYGGTGMREIARGAGVSLSMINYYFGSKQGVLEELLNQQHDRYLAAATAAMQSADTVEGKVRAWVRAAVGLARRAGPALRVAFVDLPREAPGVIELKAARVREISALLTAHVLTPLGRAGDDHLLGPGIGSMIMSHFMVRPILERVHGELADDDAFFDRYADVIADQLLYGLLGRPQPSEPSDQAG